MGLVLLGGRSGHGALLEFFMSEYCCEGVQMVSRDGYC